MNSPESALVLRRAGIADPARLVGLIRRTIAFLELDLSGLVVLTEAASGPYVVTPIMAALGGAARVIALTATTRYGSVEAVITQTRALADLCGVDVQAHRADPGVSAGAPSHLGPVVEIYADRRLDLFAAADIVTNLGFVRPIDAAVVAALKPTAVIPLMCEGWEIRPGDVDLATCRQRHIPVIATNEDYPGLEVFAYSGWLALKMLFDAQIEVHKNRLAVVSSDKFGPVIVERLRRAGADVRLLPNLREPFTGTLTELDAVIVADYTRPDPIIGPGGDVASEDFAAACAGTTVIQFAGRVDAAGLTAAGVHVHPDDELPPHRMALTLAALGPRPVIELHAAGLKVGELAARARLAGRSLAELAEVTLRGCLLGTRLVQK